MQKTVKEIIEMIQTGRLQYNQSTQRKFVYGEMEAQVAAGKTTKAGSLIYSILEEGIQLPAVYFWHNTDTGHTNIHDGKQRLLSIYYFVNTGAGIPVTVWRNGKLTNFDGLRSDEQEKLLNYTFDIVERTGNSLEEERSFFLINTNSVNLTPYECLSGMLHGNFLTGFENYLKSKSMVSDKIKAVDGKSRGEQAYKILLALFNHADSKKALSNDKSLMLLSEDIRAVRDNNFDAKTYLANDILDMFIELSRLGFNEERAFSVASYCVREYFPRIDDIVTLYKKSFKKPNDISKWSIDTHKTFINAFVNDNLELDPKRNFTDDVKDQLYQKSGRCAHQAADGTNCSETSYKKLEVDHIIPWSKGGLTILANAQLLCKAHNTSKNNN